MNLQESKEWITRIDEDGVIHKQKRATDKQLEFLTALEEQMGKEPRNHNQLTVWKASQLIDRYKKMLDSQKQQKLV